MEFAGWRYPNYPRVHSERDAAPAASSGITSTKKGSSLLGLHAPHSHSDSKSGSARTGRSVVFDGPGHPLRLQHTSIPDPADGEVIVRVEMAGVCGTDAHRLAGDVPHGREPVCFGHEVVGVIESAGADARDRAGTPLAAGDRLYWNPVDPCGTCARCLDAGDEINMRCPHLVWPKPATSANSAGFQELALVGPLAPRFRMPEGLSAESVIAFGCAMPTAIAGLGRLGRLDGTVVIQGSGPVGLACTVLATLAGAAEIIVIGDPANRLEAAARLGASQTIALHVTTPESRRARVLDITDGRGADVVIEAAGTPAAFPEGFDLLGADGRLLILGLYSGRNAAALIDPVRINNLNLTVLGSLGSRYHAFERTIEIAAQHAERLGFAALITHRFPLDKTDDAIAAAAQGEAIKAVIIPSLTT